MLVFIESWLNDDQYKEAEERGDIFSPKKPEPAEDEFQVNAIYSYVSCFWIELVTYL